MKEKERYFMMALDPIHVGSGGYKLGRVDNAIVREPATNLPKIPGTTIEGVARTYAYYKELGENSNIKKPEEACALGKKFKEKLPCGECRVCITFGFTRDDKSLHGMAHFSDGRILLFPVYSMKGPVWVTTTSILKEIGVLKENEAVKSTDENKIRTKVVKKNEKLNLGWLYLENEEEFSIPNEQLKSIPIEIKNRIVLVSDKLFTQIVNSNLEVRTSVAIDPRTGTAEERALFTYEAIPRVTILWFDVIYQNPAWFDCKLKTNSNNSIDPDLKGDIKSLVKKALELFEILGIGGMQTRGFGRARILNLKGETNGG